MIDPTEMKNNEIDQADLFDVEKNQENDFSHSPSVRGKEANLGSKKQQESPLKPHRRKRRQLAGW